MQFDDVDVNEVIGKVHEADINVMANYIYGLPGDTLETIDKTFKLSLDLCTAGWNTYAAMALPGSQLYSDAVKKGTKLPENYEGLKVPKILMSGNIKEIERWRDKKSLERTKKYRPGLL